ncbi:MAG TPA: NUDIX domain-containing protein [Candidatus Saccharimonadales bacterium]|nr:NUDIX domain-containing protein [Candidatus Saccharimonadales bacterium]
MSSNGSFRVIPTVFVAALSAGKVVLVHRQNTGFFDDFWDLPSGHIEDGEAIKSAAVRELKEETGLSVKAEDLELFNVTQNFMSGGRPYLYFMFKTEKWQGKPRVTEPNLSTAVEAHPLNNLPKVTPYSLLAITSISKSGVNFDFIAADS